jgi:ABC-2 type transport system permease protein
MTAAVARKEWLQLRHDRLTLALLVGVPLAQILLFGFAISLTPRHMPAAWVATPALSSPNAGAALDTTLTQAMLAQLRQGDVLQLPDAPLDAATARARLQAGELRLLVHWPSEPSRYVLQGQPVPLQLEVDLSDPHAQALVAQIGDGLAHHLTQHLTQFATAQGAPAVALQVQGVPLRLQIQGRYRLPADSGAYLVPALSGVILTLTLTLMAALCVVREQERGTWDALRTTPLNAGHIVLGKLLPYAGLGLAQYTLLQALAWCLFDTPWASPTLWGLATAFMLGQLGLGLCVSLLARTQLQAVQLGVFFYLPSILLSGFMFPFHSMPVWARAVGEALPLTHFLRAMRAELFRGAESAQVLSLGWPLLLFTAVVLALALLGYRRRV